MVSDSNGLSWLFDIFSWERLSNVATVISLVSLSIFVPLFQYFKKQRCNVLKIKAEKERERIEKIAEGVTAPIIDRLEKQDKNQEDIKIKQEQNDRDTRDILSTVRSLASSFHKSQDVQAKLNAKVYFMDGLLRNKSSMSDNLIHHQPQQPNSSRRQHNRQSNLDNNDEDFESSYEFDDDTNNNNNNMKHDSL